MLEKCVATFFAFSFVLTLVPQPAAAQPTHRTIPMRTPDGQPDISGSELEQQGRELRR